MASKTYKLRALVLRKTKLGDKDLIVTMLDESGTLVQGVAKGARKPGGSFAARLELFSEVDVLMAQGRSLDVVCEARRVDVEARHGTTWGLEQSACAAPLAELLCNVSQPDLEQPRVYALSRAAFKLMGDNSLTEAQCLSICAASLWKAMGQIGFRPSFSTCVTCGDACSLEVGSDSPAARPLSIEDGGVVCNACLRPADAIVVETFTLQWCEYLLMARYQDIVESGLDEAMCFDVLHLARAWARAHTGRNLKSLDFLFTSGLFGA